MGSAQNNLWSSIVYDCIALRCKGLKTVGTPIAIYNLCVFSNNLVVVSYGTKKGCEKNWKQLRRNWEIGSNKEELGIYTFLAEFHSVSFTNFSPVSLINLFTVSSEI